MNAYLDTIPSPVGLIAFAVDTQGALLRLRFVDGSYSMSIEEALQGDGFALFPNEGRADQAKCELQEYWAGTRRVFTLSLAMRGTPWQIRCWNALIAIPYGETRSYGTMAAQLGNHHAARAVGRANATNHLPLVVPCHRLIGANGALTGFEGGVEIKRQLLEHEGEAMKHRNIEALEQKAQSVERKTGRQGDISRSIVPRRTETQRRKDAKTQRCKDAN